REDRTPGQERERPSAAEVGSHAGDAARSGLPVGAEGRAIEMLLGPAVADDNGAPVPGVAGGIVITVEEERVPFEIARRPEPEELAEIALGWWLRLAGAHRPDPPAPVARARPAVAESGAFAVDRQPARPAAVLRHARIIHEQPGAVAADEA